MREQRIEIFVVFGVRSSGWDSNQQRSR